MELYRRHSPTCKHKDKGYAFTKCQCPIWVDARAEIGIRKSLKTRNWEQAIRKLDRIADKKPDAETIAGALALFLDDCRARHLAGSTILRYRNMLNPFSDYMRADAVVAEITPKNLSAYRNQRKVSANTQVKELECLKSFFWFCVNHGWLPVNPAKHLKPPVPDAPPTLPYERGEIAALLDACGRIENWYTETLERARLRAKALVLLLLYSGFRISDAVQLERSG